MFEILLSAKINPREIFAKQSKIRQYILTICENKSTRKILILVSTIRNPRENYFREN